MPLSPPNIRLAKGFRNAVLPPRIRSLRQFAEERVIVPEGQYQGARFRCDVLPWSGVLFDLIDSQKWRRVVVTGTVQGGKTLCAYVIPVLWHLFEHRERVVAGVPNMLMAEDKWRTEIMPPILSSPTMSTLLPTTGAGSKGGSFTAIAFRHGAELRFMSGHGGDEARSHYTTRIVAVTEADRLDEQGEVSREAAPIYQLEARTASYGDRGRFYAECTSTTPEGFVTREREMGTDTRLAKPCPHCGEYVVPEREHFVGWEDAASADEAAQLGTFVCPSCAAILSDDERRRMCEQSVAIHRGQTIDREGRIIGETPGVDTLGFRFNAFDNLFWSSAYIARRSWLAAHDRDAEAAELAMRQWMWAQPAEPQQIDVAPLVVEDVVGRQDDRISRGVVPEWATVVVGACDLRATQLHYLHVAAEKTGRQAVIDVGVIPVQRERYGVEKALKMALCEYREQMIVPGLPRANDGRVAFGWHPIDAGWKTHVVRWFIRDSRARGVNAFLPAFGRGAASSERRGRYQQPTKTDSLVPHLGDEYHLRWHKKHALHGILANADNWKTAVRERLATPSDQPGALLLFDTVTESDKILLRQLAQHVTSERPVERVVPGRGPVLVWENASRRANHWLDCLYWALVALDLSGVRILDDPPAPIPMPKQKGLEKDGEPIRIAIRNSRYD